MSPYRNSFDRPASNVLPFTVIGLSVAMGLYAILAVPGSGNSISSLGTTLRNLVQLDHSISVPPARPGKI